jgi:hypothetical protein
MSHSESTNSAADARTRLDHPVAYEDSVTVEVSLGDTSTGDEAKTVSGERRAELPPSMSAAELPEGTLVDRIQQRRGGKQ